jgi:outer membrane lipoprotein-sorting protein
MSSHRIGEMTGVAAACAAAMIVSVTTAPLGAAEDILQRMRATYAELRSYADTGVVIHEYGTASTDRHTFITNFNREPRRFVLDFRKQNGDRYVIWGDPDAFHTWWKATGQRYDYPNPNNAPAIAVAPNSGGTASKIPTLLYSKAALGGFLNNFVDVTNDGTEVSGGHRCHRLRGRSSDFYAATGHESNVHTTTLWIDSESLLIRKVLEEWPPLPGQRSRDITTYEPQANPAIDEGRFQFTPPTMK